MIKRRFVKLVFAALLTMAFAVMTLEMFKTKKEASSDLGKHSGNFAENDNFESRNTNTTSDLKSDASFKVKFPRSKAAPISLQKPSTYCTKGGYDVRYLVM